MLYLLQYLYGVIMDEIRAFLSDELNIAIDNNLRLKGEIRAIELDIEFMDKACNRIMNHKDATGDIFLSTYNYEAFDDVEVLKLKARKEELEQILVQKKMEYREAEERCDKVKRLWSHVNNQEIDEDDELMIDSAREIPQGYGYDIMSMQDIDRRRIAMGIHDTVVQNLTALILKNDFVVKLLNSDVQRAKLELNGINNVLKDSIRELRDIIYDLRPMSLEDLGFEDAFNNLINKLSARTDIQFATRYEADINNVDTVILSNLLRIIKELCTNAIKHSKCSIITVVLKSDDKDISLVIEDNGIGFDFDVTAVTNKSTNFGLSMVIDRIKYLNGTVISKNLKNGTRYEIVIPKNVAKEGSLDD